MAEDTLMCLKLWLYIHKDNIHTNSSIKIKHPNTFIKNWACSEAQLLDSPDSLLSVAFMFIFIACWFFAAVTVMFWRQKSEVESAQRGTSSSVNGNDDGYENLVYSDGREQMTHPDGWETIITLSLSQSCHLGSLIASISSTTPSSWTHSIVSLSAGPPLSCPWLGMLARQQRAWLRLPSVFSNLDSACGVAKFERVKKENTHFERLVQKTRWTGRVLSLIPFS